MTAVYVQPQSDQPASETVSDIAPASEGFWHRAFRSPRIVIGGSILIVIMLAIFASLPWTLSRGSTMFYDNQRRTAEFARKGPELAKVDMWFGNDAAGRSMLSRCLLGGLVSLSVGFAAAAISVLLGVTVGLLAGFRGGWTDALLMRLVDILYGLPYILLVILFKIGLEDPLKQAKLVDPMVANLVVLFSAIGLVSWLTMARVVRGQVLSLRGQPFVEAARASGLPETRIFLRHVLPNLVGPIIVYATLTIPQAILQESFLSFLGVGINPPLPTWGSLASENLQNALGIGGYWWMLAFPCIFVVTTLLCLNFLGDGLRDLLDPKREGAKI